MTNDDRCTATLMSMFADAKEVGEAALRGDFEEARFRTQQLAATALHLRFTHLAAAATSLGISLGRSGSAPKADYGVGMLRVADELNSVCAPGPPVRD